MARFISIVGLLFLGQNVKLSYPDLLGVALQELRALPYIAGRRVISTQWDPVAMGILNALGFWLAGVRSLWRDWIGGGQPL